MRDCDLIGKMRLDANVCLFSPPVAISVVAVAIATTKRDEIVVHYTTIRWALSRSFYLTSLRERTCKEIEAGRHLPRGPGLFLSD